MATTNTSAIATTQTSVQTTNYVVTPVLSDNVKDAWNKLINDLRGSGAVTEAVADIREGISEITAALKSDLQSTGSSIEASVRKEFAAFTSSSSASMDDTTKAFYVKLMGNADKSITAIAKEAVSDVWRETDDLARSLNTILDSALKDSKLDITKLSSQVIGALKTEFGDLVNEMQGNITANYQNAIKDVSLAAGTAGILVSKDQIRSFENSVVSAVASDIVNGAAKTGKDLTSEFLEMTADLSDTINRNKDNLLKILVVDGLNLVQAAAKTVWKAVKKWFKW